jgi:hypothetical protein
LYVIVGLVIIPAYGGVLGELSVELVELGVLGEERFGESADTDRDEGRLLGWEMGAGPSSWAKDGCHHHWKSGWE